MGIRGEIYAAVTNRTKSFFTEFGISGFQDYHHEKLSNYILPAILEIFEEIHFEEDIPHSRTLDREVALRFEKEYAPILATFREKNISDDVALEFIPQIFDDYVLASMKMVSLLPIADIGLETQLEAAYLGGDRRVLEYPPVAVQKDQEGPIQLLYYMGPYSIAVLSGLFRRDWIKSTGSDPVNTYAVDQIDDQDDKEDFVRLFNHLIEESDIFIRIADLQWSLTGIMGHLLGVDNFELAWYRFAKEFLDGAIKRKNAFKSGERGIITFTQTIKNPPTALKIACDMLGYLFNKGTISIPSFINLRLSGPVSSSRTILNHPLISFNQASNLVKMALRKYRDNNKLKGLSERDQSFLDAIQEAGLNLGDRARHGFWKSFALKWNDVHPEDMISEGYLPVRYHRLKERLSR